MYIVNTFDYRYIFVTPGSVIVMFCSEFFRIKRKKLLAAKKSFFSSFFSTHFPNVLLSSKWMVGIVNSRMASFKIDRQTDGQADSDREITDYFGSWRKFTLYGAKDIQKELASVQTKSNAGK